MNYHGVTLSMTFYWQPGGRIHRGYRPRWGFVTDETGFPLAMKEISRWKGMEGGGWVKLGTWPVGKHPADLWDAAKTNLLTPTPP